MKLRALTNDVAIDLGTDNTRIYYKGNIMNEPSVVAYDAYNDEIVAVGKDAAAMIDRHPETITIIRPASKGVITDFDMACRMISTLLGNLIGGVIKPRVVVSVPCGITDVERRAVCDAVRMSEMRDIFLTEAPIAGAVGAGCDVNMARGMMLVDIGGGKCNISAISLGQTVTGRFVKLGGDDFTDALIAYIEEKHDLRIGFHTAEKIKKEIGCVFPREDDETAIAGGFNLKSRKPERLVIHADETREAFADLTDRIAAEIKTALDETPTELLGDIMEDGILLTGGGALLFGLAKKLRAQLGIKVFLAEEADLCVVRGAGIMAENINNMSENSYVFTKC